VAAEGKIKGIGEPWPKPPCMTDIFRNSFCFVFFRGYSSSEAEKSKTHPMKHAALILMLFFTTFYFAQKNSIPIVNKVDSLYDPFKNLVFDKVVAFNFNYDTTKNQKRHDYIEFGNHLQAFNYLLTPKSSIRNVDRNITKELISIVSDTTTYGEQYADCFEPRLGVTFFSKNKPVFTMLICYDCGFLESTVPIPASLNSYYDLESYEWDYQKQEPIQDKPIYVRRYLKGFSEAGEKKLLNICKRLNMKYCKE
jgi:hypothetical protein